MTAAEYLKLQVNSVVEAGVLLPALSKEKITHIVEHVDPEAGTLTLRSYYFGVFIGKLCGTVLDDQISWIRVKGGSN